MIIMNILNILIVNRLIMRFIIYIILTYIHIGSLFAYY